MIGIAQKAGISFIRKGEYVIHFSNGIVAWHNDHVGRQCIDETGFDEAQNIESLLLV